MRGIYEFAVMFLTLWTVIAATKDFDQEQAVGKAYKIFRNPPTECPFQENPKVTVHLPHETDCTKFYKCDHGRRVKFDCPPGGNFGKLHYNRREQVCDWPWRAGCVTCHPRDERGICPVYSDSKISHERDNSQYYECIDCKKYKRSCSYGKSFSRTCQKCVKNPLGGRCNY